jgi:hypothetical protein
MYREELRMDDVCEKCIQAKGLKQATCVKFKIYGKGADWKSLNVDNCLKLRNFFISEIYGKMHEKVKRIATIDRLFSDICVRPT